MQLLHTLRGHRPRTRGLTMCRGAMLLRLLASTSLLVASVLASGEVLRLLPSSHECPESAVPEGANATFYRTCTFRNLYLWQGMAYYLVGGAGPKPTLSSIGLRFEIWSKLEGADAVLDFVQPIAPAAFLQLLARTAQGGQAPAAVDSTIPLAYFWKPRKIWPSSLADSCARGSGPGRANFYHFYGEWLPALGYTLCEQFGHCSYSDRSDQLQIIDVNKRYGCHQRERYPLYYHEAVSCLSPKPLHHINGTVLHSRLSLVQTAWMGLGPRCRGVPPGCYEPGSGRLPPSPGLTASWRRLLAQCFGAEADAVAPLQPLRVIVVDRLYASGRHMLNINTIMRALQSRYSPQHVRVELVYLEGMTLKQQAAVYSGSSVVVHIHGASIANYFLLPKHAVTVQLAPMLRHYKPAWYTDYLQEELRGITDIEVIDWVSRDPALAHLSTEVVKDALPFKPKLARFMANRTLWGEFLRSYSCPKWMSKEAQHVCTALLYQLNVNMPVEVAVNLTDQAILRAFEKQGQPAPAPAQLFAAPAGTGSSSAGGGGSAGAFAVPEAAGAAAAVRQRMATAEWGAPHPSATQQVRLPRRASALLLLLGAVAGAVLVLALEPLLRRHRWR